MTTVTLSPAFSSGMFLSNDGTPLNGGKLFAYIAGSSSVLAPTYDNDTGTPVQNANPIVLNSSGRLPVSVWLEAAVSYHLVLTQSDGTTVIEEIDHLVGSPSTTFVQGLIDTAVADYLPLTGGAITGNVSVSGTSTLHTVSATSLTVTGTSALDTVTATSVVGSLNANSAVISNVATPAASTDAANKAYVDTAGAAPPGTVVAFAGQSAPTGWLVCDGSSLLRADYAALYAVISTTYGAVDGTHFNIPDLRGYFVRGYDDGRGVDSGRVFGSSQADDNKAHSHGLNGTSTNFEVGPYTYFGLTPPGISDDAGLMDSYGSEARPKNIAMTYILKA